MRKLSQRFLLLMELTNSRNRTALANLLGISQSYVSQILDGKRDNLGEKKDVLTEKTAKQISKKLGIDYQWLMTGKRKAPQYVRLPDVEYEAVTIIIDAVIGGGNAMAEDPTEPIAKFELPRKIAQSFSRGFKVEGDSMYPTIVNGAYIGYDPDDKKLISNKYYCLNIPGEGLTVKRVQVEPSEQGSFKIRVISDNPMFKPYVLPQDYLEQNLLVGRVKWILQEV